MSDTLIEVKNLSKKYVISSAKQKTLKASVLSFFKKNQFKEELWAVNNVSFEAKKGETLGVIGANGAGKSTLLGLISRTITPTQGSVSVKGRISSLLELGAGFHPDLTGRENIFLNGAILGISKEELTAKYDEIVEFAGLEKFINNPVKYYSSGMYIRLAFSVAVLVDPDILLVDEVLAVGDETFKQKSFEKIKAFRESGKTILVVSHDLDTIEQICDRVLLLGEGKMLDLNRPDKVVKEYKNMGLQQRDVNVKEEWGSKEAEIKDVVFRNSDAEICERIKSGSSLSMEINYEAFTEIKEPVFGFSIHDFEGRLMYGSNTDIEGVKISSISGKGKLLINIEKINFLRGKFLFSFSMHSSDHKTNYHRLDKWFSLWVVSDSDAEGCLDVKCQFDINNV